LSTIKKGAESFAQEEFNQLIPSSDIKEFSDLSNLLNQMAKTIQKHDQSRKDFVANVSHELKTPITSIKGYLEMLSSGAVNDEENREKFLGIVSAQTERLIAIIDDLLALSYLEMSGHEGIEFETIYLSEIIDRISRYNSSEAAKRSIEIILETDKEITVQGHPLLLEQMIGNLVDNAIKYSGENKTVTIAVAKNNNSPQVSVKDLGNGIASQHLDRIFERFYRVDKARSRNAGGTGLGLAIVKHVAQLHKATLSVDSRIGKGSTFTITFSEDI
jgi:two-component system phosphate regulon sensor histidine kinase PhoR